MYYQQKLVDLRHIDTVKIASKQSIIVEDLVYMHARRKAASLIRPTSEVSIPRAIEIEITKVPHVSQ